MTERTVRLKTAPTRKLKKEQSASTLTTPPLIPQVKTQPEIGNLSVRSHLEKGISELQGLHRLLLSTEVDPDVLAAFRDSLNRVRNTAWAAQEYVVRKENEQGSTSVLSLLAGERIRAIYQLCEALTDDLKRTDIEFQRGSLVQLYEVTKTLTEQLKRVIDKL
jgi:hypothetical protein